MFNLNYTEPSEIKGVIKVKKPVYSLGPLTDVDGKTWDVRAIIGKIICAVPKSELHPYYYDTSGGSYGMVCQKWEPYLTEIME
jgi:hypothetical protein